MGRSQPIRRVSAVASGGGDHDSQAPGGGVCSPSHHPEQVKPKLVCVYF